MISLQQIANYIEQPNSIPKDELESLKQLCETYPYTQTFPLLYLKALANHQDVRLEGELQKYAFRISDRFSLYSILHQQANAEIQPTHEVEEDKIVIQAQQVELKNEAKTSQTGILPSLSDETLAKLQITPLSYNIEIEEQEALNQIQNQEQAEALNKEGEESVEKDKVTEKKTSKKVESQNFTSWLHRNELYQTYENQHRPLSVNKEIEEKVFANRNTKQEMYSPIKKAKESIDDTRIPVSETLGKIYEVQGNFSKALKVYEQLMMLIPEKKTYFAGKIEELNKKLNK